ncbi:MAG: LPS export ABC transporter periplasmic protein LptC [Verrucomicrobiota bacterium]
MPSFLKRRIPKILPALLLVTIATHAWSQEKADQKSEQKAEQKSELSPPNDPPKKPEPNPKKPKNKQPKEPGKMDIPVSKDHDAKGLKIPYFDGSGKKQMIFTIGVASRLDDDHIGLTETQVETFNDQGDHEMTIDLPKSELNVVTNVLLTKKRMMIKRDDFEIVGESMEFNLKTKQGTLTGGVRMLIYNINTELPEKSTPEPTPTETP